MNEDELKYKKAGEFLRQLRKKKGGSVFKVARELHISGNYLSTIERGVNAPSDVVLHNLAEYYSIEKSDLFAMYGKLPKEHMDTLLKCKNLRGLLTQISTEEELNEESKEKILKKIHDLYTQIEKK